MVFYQNYSEYHLQSHTQDQNPYAKLWSNQLESTKHCVFFKLQFIDRICMKTKKKILDFLCAYEIKLVMFHRNFTNWQIIFI